MTQTRSNRLRTTSYLINAVFLILTLALQGLLAVYWFQILEPELREKASVDAKIMAEAQSLRLANVLNEIPEDENFDPIYELVDRILLYKTNESEEPMYVGLRIEMDEEFYPSVPITAGNDKCVSCFHSRIELYSPDTYELIGITQFWTSDSFYQTVARDIRNKLAIESVLSLILLILAWGASFFLLQTLSREENLRRASELALTRNQEKYHRLLSNLNQYFVYTRNEEGVITGTSENVVSLFGYLPDEMVEIVGLLTSNPINQVAVHYYSAGKRSDRQLEFEAEILDKYGKKRWLLLSEVSLFDDQNNFISIEGLGRDITKQKQIESDLRIAKDQAEVANQAKGQFLANMSHEIRTPLNAIIGNTYLALRSHLDSKQKSLMKRIDSSAHVLLSLVNDILDISKIEAGKMELERIPFTIEEILTSLSNVTAIQATNKGLDIIYFVEPNIPQPLVGDPLRMGQILLNLVNNAIKFTEKGEILLSIKIDATAEDQLTLKFSVKDDGIGIAEDKQDLLFSSFNQVDNSITRKYGGTGLGLAISAKLVNLMGGEIWVDSEFSKGSTFSFTTKLEISEEVIPNLKSQAQAEQENSLLGKHILLVDDSTTSTYVLAEMLKHMGCHVSVAHSGNECLAKLHDIEETVHLMIVDWKMPEMDGVELIKRIHSQRMKSALSETSNLPAIVMLTAYGHDENYIQQIQELPLSGQLSKPVTQAKLFNILSSSLLNKSPEQTEDDLIIDIPLASCEGKKILLAEDNKLNQEVVIGLLDDIKVEVVIANNGKESIMRAKEQRFDLILMDIQMPEMDGLTACKILRNELKLTTPIIAMTAHAMREDRERSLAAGMEDHLSKPIDVDLFYKTVGQYLSISELPSHLEQVPELDSIPQIKGINTESALKRMGYKLHLLNNLLKQFHQDYSNFNTRFETYIESNNIDAQLHHIHKLKGEAGNISADNIHHLAGKIESELRLEDKPNEDDIKALYSHLSATLLAIDEYQLAYQKQQKTEAKEGAIKINVENILPLIEQLDNMLQTQQFDAIEFGEALVEKIPDGAYDEVKQLLVMNLEKLDFDEARNSVLQLKEQIDVSG